MFCAPFRQVALIVGRDVGVHCLSILDQWQWRKRFGSGMIRPHVVRIWQTEVFVEAMMNRQALATISQMPLAIDGSMVTARLEHFGDRLLLRIETDLCSRAQRPKYADAHVIATRHQRTSRCAAYALGGIEAGHASTFFGHLIQVGCDHALAAETIQIGVAKIVCKEDHDVRFVDGRLGHFSRLAGTGAHDQTEPPTSQKLFHHRSLSKSRTRAAYHFHGPAILLSSHTGWWFTRSHHSFPGSA